MTIHLKQLTSKPILHYHFVGHITHQDLNTLKDDEQTCIAQLPDDTPYHVIVDMHEVETIGASLLPKLQRTHLAQDERVDLLVVVGANPYLRALVTSLGMSTPRKTIRFCATLDDALSVIEQQPDLAHYPAAATAQER